MPDTENENAADVMTGMAADMVPDVMTGMAADMVPDVMTGMAADMVPAVIIAYGMILEVFATEMIFACEKTVVVIMAVMLLVVMVIEILACEKAVVVIKAVMLFVVMVIVILVHVTVIFALAVAMTTALANVMMAAVNCASCLSKDEIMVEHYQVIAVGTPAKHIYTNFNLQYINYYSNQL